MYDWATAGGIERTCSGLVNDWRRLACNQVHIIRDLVHHLPERPAGGSGCGRVVDPRRPFKTKLTLWSRTVPFS